MIAVSTGILPMESITTTLVNDHDSVIVKDGHIPYIYVFRPLASTAMLQNYLLYRSPITFYYDVGLVSSSNE